MIIQNFKVVRSEWPDEDGFLPWTISDGVQTKGSFDSESEAEENMERIMLNWRCDS
ncbi:hypothetical protein [Paenibacillus sp. S150]|uniref:hypothetical protein n=1 Tax=Paenibacillus sp. S150 TaxID=2749826 RepID=UPI001C59A2BC|nr:hypothetical protein [Paenibacillus sp. S150]MBW4083551.1 hypothetical protein [Paenibacillus sp. S150]